jgi:hypothetical protein
VHLPETTPIQKILCVLFILTLGSSVISLTLFIIDKPDKKVTLCENQLGLSHIMKPVTLDSKNPELSMSKYTKNCTTTVNPSMSPQHHWITDFATISVILFLAVAGAAYISKKKDPLDPHDIPA